MKLDASIRDGAIRAWCPRCESEICISSMQGATCSCGLHWTVDITAYDDLDVEDDSYYTQAEDSNA